MSPHFIPEQQIAYMIAQTHTTGQNETRRRPNTSVLTQVRIIAWRKRDICSLSGQSKATYDRLPAALHRGKSFNTRAKKQHLTTQ
jgi:hypothetical protein